MKLWNKSFQLSDSSQWRLSRGDWSDREWRVIVAMCSYPESKPAVLHHVACIHVIGAAKLSGMQNAEYP